MTKKNQKTPTGYKPGKSLIFGILRDNGIEVAWKPFGSPSPGDFIAPNGKRISVRYSNPVLGDTPQKKWMFNFERDFQKKNKTDFFICLVLDEGKDYILFVIPRANIKNSYFMISQNQIDRGDYDYFKENWDLIKEA